jgi:nicotinamide-nucleotide amidase
VSEKDVTAAIVSVGTELTDGVIQDKHGKHIAALLKKSGFTTQKISIIPDDKALLRDELQLLFTTCSLVIVTGGLGPTSDDITRETVAEVSGRPLILDGTIWQKLKNLFAGREIADTNKKQAYIPEGFVTFENPYGTASGFAGSIDDTEVIVLPGPPHELIPMVEAHLLPYIKERFSPVERQAITATSFLVPESTLEEVLQQTLTGEKRWSTRVEPYRILFTLYNGSREELESSLQRIRGTLGANHVRKGEVVLAEELLALLIEKEIQLVCAESCTGGLIGKLITDIPGSSDGFWGTFVTYSNEAKTRMLGVGRETLENYGAVSRETVEEMAAAALERSSADVAVSISGVAGPSGGTEKKPVGTVWLCAATRAGTKAEEQRFHGSRDRIRRMAAVSAMLLVEDVVLNPERLDRAKNTDYI